MNIVDETAPIIYTQSSTKIWLPVCLLQKN